MRKSMLCFVAMGIASGTSATLSAQPAAEGTAPAAVAPAPDPAAAAKPDPRAWTEKLKIRGFATTWLRAQEEGDKAEVEQVAFRVRFARLIMEASPAKEVKARMVLAFDNNNPLFNMHLTWSRYGFANVTAGQMKVPLGASVLTEGSELKLMDRPTFVYGFTKARLRDIGASVHTGPDGLFDGLVRYNLAVFNGSGVTAVGQGAIQPGYRQLLYAARLMVDPGVIVLAKKGKLQVGGSYATTVDPPLKDPSAAVNLAASRNFLGTVYTPFTNRRHTRVAGGDVTVSAYDVWLQAEVMKLNSTATADSGIKTSGMGWNVDLGYMIAPLDLQVVGRYEVFDPDDEVDEDDFTDMVFGLNYFPYPSMLVSLFAAINTDKKTKETTNQPDNHIDARLQIMF